MRTSKLVLAAIGALATGSAVAAPNTTVRAAASLSATTQTLTVNVTSSQANPGDVTVVDVSNTTTYGTCQGSTAPGTATCSISVPSFHGILLLAQPSPSERWHHWHQACSGAPGPVCHLYIRNAPLTATAALGLPSSRALVTTASPYTQGNAPNCSPNLTVTANGTGFPANQPATLSDNGNVVASGTTDSNGFVQLSYISSASEPGIYRTLVLGAGASATTDIYNSALACFGASGTGNVSFTVDYSGFDANSSTATLTFRLNAPVTLTAGSTGAGTTTTPAYPCPSGKTFDEVVNLTRGAGNFRYHATITVPFTCP